MEIDRFRTDRLSIKSEYLHHNDRRVALARCLGDVPPIIWCLTDFENHAIVNIKM
jgi:hypothetical protein